MGELIGDVVVENEGSIKELTSRIDDILLRGFHIYRRQVREVSELERSIRALCMIDRRATCKEISEFTSNSKKNKVRIYNVNRALKGIPEFARRHEPEKGRLLSYSITTRGKKLVELLDSK